MNRRTVIGLGAVSLAATMLGLCPVTAFAQQEIDEAAFLALSQRLTGRNELNATISARALAALSAGDEAFLKTAMRLAQAIDQFGLTDMRRFRDFAAAHPDLSPAAMKIISAWYLGYTGTPEGEANHDDARFVSFAGALMYEPTIDVTIVPTYARGKTDYWVTPPASLASD